MKFLKYFANKKEPVKNEVGCVILAIKTINFTGCETCFLKDLEPPSCYDEDRYKKCTIVHSLAEMTAEEAARHIFSLCFKLPESVLQMLMAKTKELPEIT